MCPLLCLPPTGRGRTQRWSQITSSKPVTWLWATELLRFSGLCLKGHLRYQGKRIQDSLHLREAESCSVTSTQLPAAAGRCPAQGKEGNKKTMSIANSFRCHASSRHLEFSKMWLSGVPLHLYLVATTTKFPREVAAGQSWVFSSNSSR